MNKAVFLDRDGTIIEDTNYLNSPTKIKFLPGAIDAIRKINQSGFKTVIISNQAGVAKGKITPDELVLVDEAFIETISKEKGRIDAGYYCPHHPDFGSDCDCRKPKPGMILKAAKDYQIDLKQSYMIGDKDIDVECGQNAGTKSIRILSNYELSSSLKPDYFAKDLKEAVEWIIKDSTQR